MKTGRFLSIICILLSSFIITLNAQEDEYSFQYYSTNDGLSQNEVTSIVQDNYGFMWFGTRGGLNRFDGYTFKRFKPEPGNPNSLHNPSIERLFVDRLGRIWIGTKSGGYSVYDPSKEEFVLPLDSARSIPERIISFEEDADTAMWMGSWSGGAYKLDLKQNENTQVLKNRINGIKYVQGQGVYVATESGLYNIKSPKPQKVRAGINGREITALIKDRNDPVLWMVGWSMNLYSMNTETLESKEYVIPVPDKLKSNAYSLMQDREGNIWVGTWGKGLYKFNVKTEIFYKIQFETKVVSGFDLDVILDIFEDAMGNVWVGTDGGGIIKISTKSRFSTLNCISGTNTKISDLLYGPDGNIWIGTQKNGLIMRTANGEFNPVPFQESVKEITHLYVRMIKYASDGNIWVNSNYGSHIVIQKKNEQYELVSAAKYYNSPALNKIHKVHDISLKGNKLWMATQQDGLYLLEKKDDSYELIKRFVKSDTKSGLSNDRVTGIIYDKQDRMLVATYSGLMMYNSQDSVFESVNAVIKDKQKPLCDIIISVFKDKEENIWFNTPCSLNKLAVDNDGIFALEEYTAGNGLSDDYINAIQQDNEGYIWLSTNAGISRLSPETGEIRNYDTTDGLGDTDFSEGASCKGSDGSLYFGGAKAISYFKPEEIEESESRPAIVITDFRILNEPVLVADKHIISSSINEVDNIVLGHKEKEFSFEFSVLDYKNPEKNHYAYWLEGYDEEWNKIGNRRHISFNNLESGNYQLHIKGTNSHGVWNSQVKTIQIKVLPPPWKTWYAILIYVLVVVGIVILITWVSIHQERLHHAVKVEKMNRNQEKEMNEYKFRFFTNISHELRTPLTLILGPVKELTQTDYSTAPKNYLTDKLELIHHNTNRLYSLVNQLLEFRKVEAGKLVLQIGEYSLKAFVKEIANNYKGLAASQNITFTIDKHTSTKVFFDKERLSVVLNNLLSNAFKYVDAEGLVSVEIEEQVQEVIIKVNNSGSGISAEDQKHLFDRFYQAGNHQHMGSSGIGLALARNYIALHQGEILVNSVPGGLTTFSIVLKKGKDHFGDVVFVDDKHQTEIADEEVVKELNQPVRTRSINTKAKGTTVLVVEDNKDVQLYLSDLLSNYFNVITANNGLEGYKEALQHIPKLIISDVMMPQMDGFELCEKVKSHDKLLQVPVMLLTAKNTDRDTLYGTKKGADAYLTKPFEPELLIEKAKQLIASRVMLSEKYAKKVILEPTDKDLNKQEAAFIDKVIKLVEKQMDNPNFDAAALASEMAMSSSTFYRKIKQLTQMAPGVFIRSIKLKRAEQLLRKTNLSVSEIIDEIGYADSKSFRKNFKETYQMLPTEYRKNNKV